jgi:hypothetical protein
VSWWIAWKAGPRPQNEVSAALDEDRSFGTVPAQFRGGAQSGAESLKQLQLLAENFRHPSLQAKKYDESRGIWQARVNRDWRFYFKTEGEIYYLIDVITHPK